MNFDSTKEPLKSELKTGKFTILVSCKRILYRKVLFNLLPHKKKDDFFKGLQQTHNKTCVFEDEEKEKVRKRCKKIKEEEKSTKKITKKNIKELCI